MFATERLNIIKSYLREHRRLDVHSISDLLNVSEVTIRRDLEKLESEGFLTRIHGGAVPADGDVNEDLSSNRVSEPCEGLAEIALVAASLVHDGDVVAIINGPMAPLLARRLANRSNLTVLTNHFLVAQEIARHPANKVVLLGGSVVGDEEAVFGSLALANLRNYYVNQLFYEIDGVSEQLQLTVKSQEKADLIHAALACSSQNTALCLAENFGKNAFSRLGSANEAGRIITNPDLSDLYKEKLFGMGIQLFTSIHAYEGSL